jgi:cytochrome P450
MGITSDSTRPPGPRGQPLIGSALQARRALEFITENTRAYGDVVYYEFLNEPIYQVAHPDDIESVLVTNNQAFVKSHLTRKVLDPIAETGLFTSEGDAWREQRHRIQPAFQPAQIAVYTELMAASTERMLETWAHEDRIDLHDEMMKLTLDIVARALLGVEIERDVRTVGENLAIVLKRVGSVAYHVEPSWSPTPGNQRFKRALNELRDVVDRIIVERRATPGGDDVVSRLLAAETERGEPMSDQQLRDEVMTFLIAGHETTAMALTYTFYLLATHPGVEHRLLDELTTVLDGAPPTMAEVRELTLTERVITESLRLYPPVSDIHREPVEDVVIGGYLIPAGVTVSLPPWVVHRDPRWYDDPLAFRPDRWTNEFRAALPRLAYFPFGAGPRRCVGERFALLEATIVLATVLQRYHLELCPETSFELESLITTRPKHPIWMRLHSRTERT